MEWIWLKKQSTFVNKTIIYTLILYVELHLKVSLPYLRLIATAFRILVDQFNKLICFIYFSRFSYLVKLFFKCRHLLRTFLLKGLRIFMIMKFKMFNAFQHGLIIRLWSSFGRFQTKNFPSTKFIHIFC